MITDLALMRLLQLVSPSLPIGMYCYSQGLEHAVEEKQVSNDVEAREWIAGVLEKCLTQIDLPILSRLYDAWEQQDIEAVEKWSATILAYRETSELRAEDRQTGEALAKLLVGMGISEADNWQRKFNTTQATLFALAAVKWGIPKHEALAGFLWSWLENQVLCAVKLVPLGQLAGQRLSHNLSQRIPALLQHGLQLDDDEIGGSVFGLALASSRHEMQYSRLFRS
ncbi:MAG: urease accessory protein UreF [Methylococcales symbiont of Hymedesmia sp. n. MRB-2018]|nr:MAG: urease accessory protein UreF [Methylococcales symbiont of Hymedesmia sp. n. MRB-2018]KAF3982841.1 MAG: urease accessory protein UreF [Methylococcales symbiont of Hymedesmia sp. n. MRB-2018]